MGPLDCTGFALSPTACSSLQGARVRDEGEKVGGERDAAGNSR